MANAPKKMKRPWVMERKPFERQRHQDDFDYNGRKWRNLRKIILAKHPLCVMCEREGLVEVATVVDHIIPVKKGGAGYDENNLQSLCKKHHDSKSARDK